MSLVANVYSVDFNLDLHLFHLLYECVVFVHVNVHFVASFETVEKPRANNRQHCGCHHYKWGVDNEKKYVIDSYESIASMGGSSKPGTSSINLVSAAKCFGSDGIVFGSDSIRVPTSSRYEMVN